jgi:hypothetical protein
MFNEVFSGYQPRQTPDDDDDDRDDPRTVGSVDTPDAADSPRRFHRI